VYDAVSSLYCREKDPCQPGYNSRVRCEAHAHPLAEHRHCVDVGPHAPTPAPDRPSLERELGRRPKSGRVCERDRASRESTNCFQTVSLVSPVKVVIVGRGLLRSTTLCESGGSMEAGIGRNRRTQETIVPQRRFGILRAMRSTPRQSHRGSQVHGGAGRSRQEGRRSKG
jgi:hypothetical protein